MQGLTKQLAAAAITAALQLSKSSAISSTETQVNISVSNSKHNCLVINRAPQFLNQGSTSG
jgi:Tfp pilus assembly protein FimT